MANIVFNVAKGRFIEMYNRVKSNDPAASQLVVVLCTGSETDDTIRDADTLSAVLATSLAECTFTNYARIDLDDTDLAALPAPDDTSNDRAYTLPDQTISNAGGASNETTTRCIVCYDATGSDADSALLPLHFHDFAATTNGGDLTIDFPTTELATAGE